MTKNNVTFALTEDHVSLALDTGLVLLDGDLYGMADVDSSTWIITDGRFNIEYLYTCCSVLW